MGRSRLKTFLRSSAWQWRSTPSVVTAYRRSSINPSIEAFLTEVLTTSSNRSPASMDALLATYRFASEISDQIRGSCFQDCPSLSPAQLEQLTEVIREVEGLKQPLFGWLLRRGKLLVVAAKCQRISTFRKAI